MGQIHYGWQLILVPVILRVMVNLSHGKIPHTTLLSESKYVFVVINVVLTVGCMEW